MKQKMKKGWIKMKRSYSQIGVAVLLVIAMVALILLCGCAGSTSGKKTVSKSSGTGLAQSKQVNTNSDTGMMDPKDIDYYPTITGRYWINGGKTFVMEGAFYNFTNEFDVVSLEDCVIYLVDKNENIIASANINEAAVGVIPHNGSAQYNITFNNVPGGSSSYAANELFPRMESYFSYAKHDPTDCPYCHNVSVNTRPSGTGGTGTTGTHVCGWCGGKGTTECSWCNGTGKNADYENLSPIQKGMSKPYCIVCDGKGYLVCGRCNGRGFE